MIETDFPKRPRSGALRPWGVWVLGAVAFGYGFFMRVSPSAMVGDLMRDFAVGAAVLGNLSAIYFYVYAGLQIPIGALMDRWGPRVMITGSVAIAALGTGLFAWAQSIELAYVGRALIGGGSACAFVGSLMLVGRWFPPNRFAFLSGLTMFGGMAGGVLGQAPLALLLTYAHWRTSLYGAAVFAALLSAALWLTVRDSPPDREGAAPRPRAGMRELMRNVTLALGNARVWLTAGIAASMSGLLLAFGGLWGVPYLMVRYGIERPDAALCVTFNLIGWAVGAPLSGWLSDRIGRRKAPLAVAGVGILGCLALLLYGGFGLYVSTGLIFFIGVLSASMVICFALARESAQPQIQGAVTGIINTGAVGAGAVLQPLIGLILDHQWDGTIVDGARIYSTEAYTVAFTSLIAWAAMGLVCLMFVRETWCRPLKED